MSDDQNWTDVTNLPAATKVSEPPFNRGAAPREAATVTSRAPERADASSRSLLSGVVAPQPRKSLFRR